MEHLGFHKVVSMQQHELRKTTYGYQRRIDVQVGSTIFFEGVGTEPCQTIAQIWSYLAAKQVNY